MDNRAGAVASVQSTRKERHSLIDFPGIRVELDLWLLPNEHLTNDRQALVKTTVDLPRLVRGNARARLSDLLAQSGIWRSRARVSAVLSKQVRRFTCYTV